MISNCPNKTSRKSPPKIKVPVSYETHAKQPKTCIDFPKKKREWKRKRNLKKYGQKVYKFDENYTSTNEPKAKAKRKIHQSISYS